MWRKEEGRPRDSLFCAPHSQGQRQRSTPRPPPPPARPGGRGCGGGGDVFWGGGGRAWEDMGGGGAQKERRAWARVIVCPDQRDGDNHAATETQQANQSTRWKAKRIGTKPPRPPARLGTGKQTQARGGKKKRERHLLPFCGFEPSSRPRIFGALFRRVEQKVGV